MSREGLDTMQDLLAGLTFHALMRSLRAWERWSRRARRLHDFVRLRAGMSPAHPEDWP